MIRSVSKIELIILYVVLILSIILGVIFIDKINMIDFKILTFVRENFNHGLIKDIMYLISLLLSPIPMAIIFVIICLISKDKSVAIHIIVNVAAAAVLNYILKNIFQRERPFEFFLIDETGYSFPSAHSMIAVAFYGTMIYCANKYLYGKKIGIVISIILWVVMVLTPISRVYLGVHNFTDILVGSLIGAIIVRTSIFLLNEIIKKNEKSMLDEAIKKKV